MPYNMQLHLYFQCYIAVHGPCHTQAALFPDRDPSTNLATSWANVHWMVKRKMPSSPKNQTLVVQQSSSHYTSAGFFELNHVYHTSCLMLGYACYCRSEMLIVAHLPQSLPYPNHSYKVSLIYCHIYSDILLKALLSQTRQHSELK
jgi:hypothetical protein